MLPMHVLASHPLPFWMQCNDPVRTAGPTAVSCCRRPVRPIRGDDHAGRENAEAGPCRSACSATQLQLNHPMSRRPTQAAGKSLPGTRRLRASARGRHAGHRHTTRLATAVSAKNAGDTSAKPAAEETPQNTPDRAVKSLRPARESPARRAIAERGSTYGLHRHCRGIGASGSSQLPDTSKPSAENVTQIEAAAQPNDSRPVRAAAQTMRRAGVVMPGPLLPSPR